MVNSSETDCPPDVLHNGVWRVTGGNQDRVGPRRVWAKGAFISDVSAAFPGGSTVQTGASLFRGREGLSNNLCIRASNVSKEVLAATVEHM
jgi:hypothetical protein